MKTRHFKLSLIAILSIFCSCGNEKDGRDFVNGEFDFASRQLTLAISETHKAIAEESPESIKRREDRKQGPLVSPRTIEDGKLRLVVSGDWTSGFFPGELWYMFEKTGDNKWQSEARAFTEKLEREKTNGGTHDMGFKVYCSFGNGYRLTGDPHYRDILLESAYTLTTRYNPDLKVIRSWDHNRNKWEYPVIIDNMLNLELLFWAYRESGDQLFYDIAVNHAETTMKNHFREDYSTYHVIDYDPETLEVRKRNTHQGYAHESTWSRGEAWALYGYTMCYRETGKTEFLEQARNIAGFIFNHPNLPQDLIPYWDYDAPEIPGEPRDVSAATVTSSALYELSMYVPEMAGQYKQWADTILENLAKDYKAKPGEDYGFLLLHSTGSKAGNSEIDVPLVYADYYYLESLLRKEKLETSGTVF